MSETYDQAELRSALGHGGLAIGIQSVLYNTNGESLRKSVQSIVASIIVATREGYCGKARLHYGDCSPLPCISDDELHALQMMAAPHLEIDYTFFNANLGSARGHNVIVGNNDCDALVIMNPDIVLGPTVLSHFVKTLVTVNKCGQVEARQIPIEHPKAFNPVTGLTSWASTCCCMMPLKLFKLLGAFDAENFFLYGDDVDYSWRTRLAGFDVIHQPAAFVFHDKRLDSKANWRTSAAEEYYSAESALLLTYRWSRDDLTARYLSEFLTAGGAHHKKARATFLERMDSKTLPAQLDPEHRIGQFVDYAYAEHRYKL